jgi:putative hydrolase of the HAD superfamily
MPSVIAARWTNVTSTEPMTENLLFDLGGVIMDIDRNRCVEAFKNLGMENADSFFGEYRQKGPFLQLEAGTISPEDFRAAVRQLIPGEVTDDEIDSTLCRFLIGIPPERLSRLRELRGRGHKVWMLSNTNAIMWQRFILPEFGGDVSEFFDGVVTSFEAGVCKPDEAIYRYAISHLGINPAETTFFDDGAANVAAAEALGFHGVHITADNDFLTATA